MATLMNIIWDRNGRYGQVEATILSQYVAKSDPENYQIHFNENKLYISRQERFVN